MTFINVVIGFIIFVLVSGVVGYKVANYLDIKYGTDER